MGRIAHSERAAFTGFRGDELNLEVLARNINHQPSSHTARRFVDVVKDVFATHKSRRRRFVQTVIRNQDPSVVIVEFLRLTYTVQPSTPSPRPGEKAQHSAVAVATPPLYWIDTHDVMHERTERYRAAGEKIAHPVTAAEEARLLSRYDAILAIQKAEARTFGELIPSKLVLVVPHGIDVSKFDVKRAKLTNKAESPNPNQPIRLGFLGGRDASNARSLDWFVANVWPELRTHFGDRVVFDIAGQVCAHWTSNAPGVVCIGRVSSSGQFWNTVDIAVNPIQFGSGLKIKNVQALAHGCALLTTPIGGEGLEAACPSGMNISTGAREWTKILSEWIADADLRNRIGRNARHYTDTHLTEAAAFSELKSHLVEALRARSDG